MYTDSSPDRPEGKSLREGIQSTIEKLKKASDFLDEGEVQRSLAILRQLKLPEQNPEAVISRTLTQLHRVLDQKENPAHDLSKATFRTGASRYMHSQIRESYEQDLGQRNGFLLAALRKEAPNHNDGTPFTFATDTYRFRGGGVGKAAGRLVSIETEPFVVEISVTKKDAPIRHSAPWNSFKSDFENNCRFTIRLASPFTNQTLGRFVFTPEVSLTPPVGRGPIFAGKQAYLYNDKSILSPATRIAEKLTESFLSILRYVAPNKYDISPAFPNGLEHIQKPIDRWATHRSEEIERTRFYNSFPLALTSNKELWQNALNKLELTDCLDILTSPAALNELRNAAAKNSDLEPFKIRPQSISPSAGGLSGRSRKGT